MATAETDVACCVAVAVADGGDGEETSPEDANPATGGGDPVSAVLPADATPLVGAAAAVPCVEDGELRVVD